MFLFSWLWSLLLSYDYYHCYCYYHHDYYHYHHNNHLCCHMQSIQVSMRKDYTYSMVTTCVNLPYCGLQTSLRCHLGADLLANMVIAILTLLSVTWRHQKLRTATGLPDTTPWLIRFKILFVVPLHIHKCGVQILMFRCTWCVCVCAEV